MTPEQIQSEIDSLTGDLARCVADGERRAASVLSGVIKRLQAHLPAKAPEPPVEAAPAPRLEPELVGVPGGVFDRFTSKSGR